jgi:hypothetical protein
MVVLSSLQPNPCSSPYYYLEIKEKKHSIEIIMRMLTPIFYSGEIPQTVRMLRDNLPSVLRCQCFNSAGFPFRHEVKDTEMGHLFEHLIIEFMCQEKLNSGARSATFSAVTFWNWNHDPRGTFHIEIEAKPSDFKFFYPSLKSATALLNKIIDTKFQSILVLQDSYEKPSNLLF